jgi:FMN phosphatase YigB (HAD superfamily)
METVSIQKIKNIIFDYGNVIFEIDFKKAQNALLQLGITNINAFFAHKSHDQIFNDFETAGISPAEFRNKIRLAAGNNTLTDHQIDEAWNSLLIGIPSPSVHETLLKVKKRYRTFLLSNNNQIHYDWIIDYLRREFNVEDNNHLFEKTYYSQQMMMRKPNVEIFEKVLLENQLKADETLFIDDSPQHIAGARLAGLNTLLMDRHPRELEQFLVEHYIL